MSLNSSIEWTDATWNPVRGCDKVSPGCKHCYAETFAERFRGVPGHPYEQGFDIRLVPDKVSEPLKWASSKTIFVNSMSDLFHKNVPTKFITLVSDTMRLGDWHVYQVLTKRAERLSELLNGQSILPANMAHVWWGVSVEDKKYGKPRIDYLRDTPAVVKFLSIEPLLEDLGELNLKGIDWVIVGGESGAGARPMDESWVTSILDQCRTANVPFFFKQWGGVQKKKNGRELLGRTFDEMPERVVGSIPSVLERKRKIALTEEKVAKFLALNPTS